jgi:hypothetical protein
MKKIIFKGFKLIELELSGYSGVIVIVVILILCATVLAVASL